MATGTTSRRGEKIVRRGWDVKVIIFEMLLKRF
jgi:hypothetical protein